jgi:hypothetical protein
VQLLEEWRVWCKFSNEPYDIVIRQYYGQSVRAMTSVLQPFHLLVIALSGWLNRQQLAVIDYLIEENRVLKEQLEARNKLGNRLIEEVITHAAGAISTDGRERPLCRDAPVPQRPGMAESGRPWAPYFSNTYKDLNLSSNPACVIFA